MNNHHSSSSSPADPEAAIAKLRSGWPQLGDMDRALAVASIKRSGRSTRFIARQLGSSESLLRHLLKALQAPAADVAAARRGELTTNELIRRAKAEAVRQEQQQVEYRQRERQQKATEAGKAIRIWLKHEGLDQPRGDRVALEAREMLLADLAAGRLPPADPDVLHPAAEWIERCRPQTPPRAAIGQDSHYIGLYAKWLAQWTFCFCRDPEIAIDALAKVGRL